jgi:hypothetical protein
MNDDLSLCCGEYPTQWVPAYWGNLKMTPTADYSISCGKCGREVHGKHPDEAKGNWEAIDVGNQIQQLGMDEIATARRSMA